MTLTLRFPDLTFRSAQPELMDDAASDVAALYQTLPQFAVINRLFSRERALFKKIVFRDIKKRGLASVTILDVGAGGGDFARWCVAFLRRRRIVARVLCIDNDRRVVGYLNRACSLFPEIDVVHASALRLDEPALRADYIVANHLLHHLPDEQIPAVLAGAFSAARYGLLFNDLVRHGVWYALFLLISGIFFRRGFIRNDGLLSIRKGFTRGEVQRYIEQSGLCGRFRVGRSAFGHVYVHAVK